MGGSVSVQLLKYLEYMYLSRGRRLNTACWQDMNSYNCPLGRSTASEILQLMSRGG